MTFTARAQAVAVLSGAAVGAATAGPAFSTGAGAFGAAPVAWTTTGLSRAEAAARAIKVDRRFIQGLRSPSCGRAPHRSPARQLWRSDAAATLRSVLATQSSAARSTGAG